MEADREKAVRAKAYQIAASIDAALGRASRSGKSVVDSVLRYFEGFERAARLRNKRGEYAHFEQCWLCVHQAFYGIFSLPSAPLTSNHTSVVDYKAVQNERRNAKWFVDVQSRPMRAVTGKKISRGRTYLILGCGHRLECFDTSDTRKHARCRECKGLLNEINKDLRKMKRGKR